jgi:hypothetical protein
MTATDDSVHDRLADARIALTPTRLALALTLLAALGFVLLFAQAPMLHDSMHNFRHAAGIVCH